ncbi:MAG: PASTA domain-containing protein [Solobacterium sp.]|nr:PASTA domain-containing protein [Solobacterium sp.]
MNNRGNRAVILIFITALAVMGLLAANVFYVTIFRTHLRSGTDLSAYADSANTIKETEKALRGNIYARDGTIIAEDNRTYNIICVLDENRLAVEGQIAYVQDKERTATELARILRTSKETLLGYLNQDVYQTELGLAGRNLSESTRNEIIALGLPGIEFTDSIQRVYPLGTFASNLIGFAQSDETGSTIGRMGTELYLDTYLRGEDGYRIYQADKNGYILPGMKSETKSARNGNNIYTTLVPEIQEALEETFLMTEQNFHADRIWGAVMEIETGKLLAWGQYPGFDPNTLEITDYNNYGAQLPYEPGSTLKSVTWAAAINEGVYDGEELVDSNIYYYNWDEDRNPHRAEYGSEHPITNASNNRFGMIDYDHGLMYSSNVVAATIQTELLGSNKNLEYLKAFGFFSSVKTDGMPEETGYLNFTWPADKIAISYGQGSTVTMLQMLQAYSAIFGNGTMVRPYYVESIRDGYDNNHILYQAEVRETGNPITEATARQVQEILYRTVNSDDGTAKYYRIPECDIIGKTGTTQVAHNGTYMTGYTIASFMSAMPADDPKVMVYYCFEAPYNPNAHVNTAPVQNLLRKTAMKLGYANVAGEEVEEEPLEELDEFAEDPSIVRTAGEMPNLLNHTLNYAGQKLAGLNGEVLVLGGGNTIIAQYPSQGVEVNGEKIFLVTDTNSFIMPDMTGWTRKDVSALWQVTQFGFRLHGEGLVVSQNIDPGTLISKGTEIEVEFE